MYAQVLQLVAKLKKIVDMMGEVVQKEAGIQNLQNHTMGDDNSTGQEPQRIRLNKPDERGLYILLDEN